MSSQKIISWGGVAGVCCGLFWLMAPIAGTTMAIALILGLGGLISLYTQQRGQGGKLALTGFALEIIGTIIMFVALWQMSIIFSGPSYLAINLKIERHPALAAQIILFMSLAFLTLGIGLAMLGVASLRAKTLPRWQSLPLGLGLLNIILSITIVLFAYVPLSQGRNPFDPWPPAGYGLIFAEFVLLGIGWMGLGTTLVTDADAQTSQLSSAST